MTPIGAYREVITFQRADDSGAWSDYATVRGHINGLSGNEFFVANAGYEAALTVTISCRFQLALMRVTPMQYRAISNGIVYELISPADDINYRNEEIKFRAKRIYTEEDGNADSN